MKSVKAGLAAFCARWFREVGLQGDGSDLSVTIKQDYERMLSFLSECFDEIVAPGVISTVEESANALEVFRANRVDALVLVHIVWSEDQPLLAFLKGSGAWPLLLWNYHPTGFLPPRLTVNDLFRCSGTVGMLQGSTPLQRSGLAFDVISGTPGDIRLKKTLQEYRTAFGIRQEFRGLSAGRLGGRCEMMTGTFVDKDALRSRLGVNLLEITAREYAAVCETVSARRINDYYADLTGRFPREGVSEKSLRLAGRNTLALDDLVLKHNLGALAIQDLDPELHRLAGTRPCLCPPASAEQGVAFGMEGDLTTTLGLLAAMRAASAPGMFTEIFTFDPAEHTLLMGHAGVHDPSLADQGQLTIVPDAEYRSSDTLEGAWQEFILAPGPVTCVNLYDTGACYRLTVFNGISLGAPRRLHGYAHAMVKISLPVEQLLTRFVRRGMTQHFAVIHGNITNVLEKWCRISGIAFCREVQDNGEH
jgi:L-arabinose isomerase